MPAGRRWSIHDRYGNYVYLTEERWEHIADPNNHPEMADCEDQLRETIETGIRKQDSLNPRKYRYTKEFDGLAADNTHIVAIVLFGFTRDAEEKLVPNNYITTAYQKGSR